MTESEFTLKAAPPRMPRAAVERARLHRFWDDVHDRAAIFIVAPAGFGKTTLLLQWRQRWMEQGAMVAWLTADDQDDPARFTMALLQSLHSAYGIGGDERLARKPYVEALTGMLSEIASRGTLTVIMIDDAEQLPAATMRDALQYLLLNAPANLHVAIGSRVRLPLQTAELGAKGDYATLATEDLRLGLEESIEIQERRFGARLGLDERARLHEVTEGWPIGLQLAIAAVEREPDPAAAIRSLSARHGTLQEYFVESLLARLAPDVAAHLVRIAILDRFDVELFEAVTGCADAVAQLDLLVRETPIMMADERVQWFRLHGLARDFLLSRFEQLPRSEQAELHARASRWFAAKERFHEAALHALAAGDVALAQNFAARSLWSLSTSGKLAEAREWLDRLPRKMIARDTELRLVAASILAFSDRNAEAFSIAREVLREPDTPPQSRVAALRIAAGAAAFGDRLGLIPDLLPRWPGLGDPGGAPLYTMTCLNARAIVALHAGDTAQVRELIAQQAVHGSAGELRMAAALGRMLVGLSYLWDGDPIEAEAAVRPSLAEAEAENRRGMIACLHASVVAAALLERDQLAAAHAVLANRLDVIERCGFPDIILCAYRTLARIALGQGDQRRALSVLDSLDALGRRRELPRLRLYSLAEQVRIHAGHGWTDAVDKLLRGIDELAGQFEDEAMLPLQPEYRLVAALAKVHAALARDDLDAADRHLDAADALAAALHRRLDAQRVKVLRAVTARRRGDSRALPLLREAVGLAALAGQVRLLTDTHPLATQMMDELQATASAPQPPAATAVSHTPEFLEARPSPQQAELLTSKEAAILGLLHKGMPNKLIARNLDISGETVKWHLKNVYLKLSVGSRRHAVERARVLGLTQ